MKEKKIFQPATSNVVCLTYGWLLKRGRVSFPITEGARNKIDALIASINGIYFEKEIYPTAEEKVIAYLYFIIKDHPFTDGNKRTACLTFEVVCSMNNLYPDYEEDTLDKLAVYIEKTRELDHQQVIRDIAALIFP